MPNREYYELVKRLRSFAQVFVCGAHRSGTAIATRCLAHNLGYEFLHEMKAFKIASINEVIKRKKRWVLQAPTWTHVCHLIDGRRQFTESEIPDLPAAKISMAVVFVFRPIEEIAASERRIHWAAERSREHAQRRYGNNARSMGQAAQDHWSSKQKELLGTRGFELHYHWLRGHNLWVTKKDRAKFKPQQFEP